MTNPTCPASGCTTEGEPTPALNLCGFCDMHCPHGAPHRALPTIDNDSLRERLGLAPYQYDAWLNGSDSAVAAAADSEIRQRFNIVDDDEGTSTADALQSAGVITIAEADFVNDEPAWSLWVSRSDGERANELIQNAGYSAAINDVLDHDDDYELCLKETVTRQGAEQISEFLAAHNIAAEITR